MADGVRIILDGDVTRDEIRSALEQVGMAQERELPATHESPLEILFRDGKGRLARYTEDQFICVKYLDVAPDIPKGIVGRLRLLLPYMPTDNLMSQARAGSADAQERIDLMMSAAALESHADRRQLIDLIAERLQDASPAVRLAALTAAGWLGWPELKPLVQPLAADPDAEVASFAADTKTGFERA